MSEVKWSAALTLVLRCQQTCMVALDRCWEGGFDPSIEFLVDPSPSSDDWPVDSRFIESEQFKAIDNRKTENYNIFDSMSVQYEGEAAI